MDHEHHAWLERVHSENQQLKHADDASATVEQGVGVLIDRFRLAPDRGRIILTEVSHHLNETPADVAAEIIHWGLGEPLRPQTEAELRKLVDEE
ncbi:ANTAR domain-containing protein [Streptomyces sp. NPDC055056]